MKALPVTATVQEYEQQAQELLRGHAEGAPWALRLIHEHHPRFLHPDVRWLPLRLSEEEIRRAEFDEGDSRLALARWYSFQDWGALVELATAVGTGTSETAGFELASEAVIGGDLDGLGGMLRDRPDLVRARSSRRTCHDPAVHRATLLHYVAANGVEGYRQRTPANAVAVARTLLDAGAEPDALADMYGGKCTPLSMLVSSSPPAQAGVQLELIELLLDRGADPNGRGGGNWVNPVLTALVFGFIDAAAALARRGARTDRLAAAAGLGNLSHAAALLADADSEERHRAFALAAQLGHTEIVRMLLDGGEDPDRFNPEGMHSHATPLHQAALAGHEQLVRLLVSRGARLDITDKLWNSTPRGWAGHGGHQGIADYLRDQEA